IVLPLFQAAGHRQRSQVRSDSSEDMRLLNSSEHHGLTHAIALQCLNELVELADLNPVDSFDVPLQFRLCFTDVGNRRYGIAQPLGILCENDRKAAVARDEPDPLSSIHQYAATIPAHPPIPRPPVLCPPNGK